MRPAEIVHRVDDEARKRVWRHRPPSPPVPNRSRAAPVVPAELTERVDPEARAALVAEAEELLNGRWMMFGRQRHDMHADVDWYLDFVGGRRAPEEVYSLGIDHRDEARVGNIKFVWEPARHHHLTLLAMAYALTDDERFAVRVDRELRNYWAATPFLRGIHWTSGIELGIRLLAWTWIRRLLDHWPAAPALFEDNPVFVDHLGRHQQWIASLGSHGSSANNHVIAEAAGQFVAASAFPRFEDSRRWQHAAAEQLAQELSSQTFADGSNRELASDYHGFVLELGLVAWVEAVLVAHPVAPRLAEPLAAAMDALQVMVDSAGRPHRQADSDDAHGLLVDPVDYHRWASLLRTAPLVVEPAGWWVDPDRLGGSGSGADVRSAVFASCVANRAEPRPRGGWAARDAQRGSAVEGARPAQLPEAGLTFLRRPGRHPAPRGSSPLEPRADIWCCIDHGPHGYLSTAAHAHADALAIEVRVDGVEVVADPGTYCYHGEPEWRDHFRSTAAHATVMLDDADQSKMAGPFLWATKAVTHLEAATGLDDGAVAMVQASHDGYRSIGLLHRRRVELHRNVGALVVVDAFHRIGNGPPDRSIPIQVGFPLGPSVEAELVGSADASGRGPRHQSTGSHGDSPGEGAAGEVQARLHWPGGGASLGLDGDLRWVVLRGSELPRAGWYSARFGTKRPMFALVGRAEAVDVTRQYRTIIKLDVDSS
jgi:hypothetical protein